MKEVYEKLFEIWMHQNHPYYFAVVGFLWIIWFLCFVLSGFFIFLVSWWWKTLIASIVYGIALKLTSVIVMNGYISDFKEGKNKVKL